MKADAPDGKTMAVGPIPGVPILLRRLGRAGWVGRHFGVLKALLLYVQRNAQGFPNQAAAMKLLVTGGAGYIGSIVARQLLDAGHW